MSYYGNIVFLILELIKIVSADNCVDSAVHCDKFIEHQVFRKLGSQSLYTCASECLMSSACLSFGFDKKTHTCLLNSNSCDTSDVVDIAGFIFSDIKHWPKSLSGPCTQMICPNNSRCEVTRLGRARCVPEFQGCGRPPDMIDANTMYDGHYRGAVATYACDYRTCYNNVTCTCQSSGAWGSLPGQRVQFRWHNPQIQKRYSFPCGPASKFKLKTNATPTEHRRWEIRIWQQTDAVFYTDFRLSYRGNSGIVVINSKIDAQWGSAARANLAMAVGRKYEVEITLEDGVYKLVVDGASIINFTERIPGAKPDGFTFASNVTLNTMKLIS